MEDLGDPRRARDLTATAPAIWPFDLVLDGCGEGSLRLLMADAGLVAGLAPQQGALAGEALRQAASAGGTAAEVEFAALLDGAPRIFCLLARLEPAGAGRGGWRIRGLFRDITDRRTSERHEHLLRQEMAHRAKNLFAVVAALLTIAAREAPEAQAYAQAMRERITALAAAYRYLEAAPGTEAGSSANFGGLARDVLAPYRDAVAVELPPEADGLAIGARAATGIALLLYELATNAAKYGALAHGGGVVTLSGRLEGGTLHLQWAERGGPGLPGAPAAEGFGTQLLDRIAARLLGASVERRWQPGGLLATLSIAEPELAA